MIVENINTDGTAVAATNEKKVPFVEQLAVDDDLGSLKETVIDVETTKGIVENVLSAEDDPNLPTWTFRTFFIGFGLAIFGSVLQEIYYFKPQTVSVSGIFLLMIAYTMGEAMSYFIPRRGILKYLNPHPFNSKEHAAIYIIANSASAGALGTEVLAVQKLWYHEVNAGLGIFVLFSSQLLGYGFVGLLRKALIYPTKMMYPSNIQYANTLQMLHSDKKAAKSKLKLFYTTFAILFFWEVLPEYMFPLLVGVSIPCLAASNSSVVSRIFGGADGNEGLGFLSICLDWNYIGSPQVQPLQTTCNQLVGYFLCMAVFVGVYYNNIWNAKNFPFLSQSLYYGNSTAGNYYLYDQSLILDQNNNLNKTALAEQGVPYISSTYVVYLIATNMAVSATFVFMSLYHWDVMKIAFEWMKPSNLREILSTVNWKFWTAGTFDGRLDRYGQVPEGCDDPHFKAMLKYKEVPQWWYAATVVLSVMVALICLYQADTQLPWWQFIVAIILSFVLVLFLGGLNAIFGFVNNMQTTIQMIGGYIKPGNPLANMYFTLYGYNSVTQAFAMMGDLKTAQYVKLSPRSTFAAQFLGTTIGAVFNFIIMENIVSNQEPILKSIQGTNIWSGQNVQQYNTQGVTWGALPTELYSIGSRYQWVPLAFLLGFVAPIPFYLLYRRFPNNKIIRNISVPIMISNIGWLVVGINSGITTVMVIAFSCQWYLRKYHPKTFANYNYLLAAGAQGGTQVMIFILSFAVYGASGNSNPFPVWWGNYQHDSQGSPANVDHCKYVN
jgi:OPT family small oligopeptide transporter